MRKVYLLSLFLLLSAAASFAQSIRLTVKLKYKKATGYSLSQPSAFLSEKAIERRTKQNLLIDSTDLPVNRPYLDSIRNIPGVSILSSSKWLNQVLVETENADAINAINSLTFVAHTRAVAKRNRKRNEVQLASIYEEKSSSTPSIATAVTADTINYGSNYQQVHIHEGEFLHNNGFRGQGMTVAILDAGFFKYTTNPAFDSVRINGQVLGAYDFVNDETSVDEDNVHGANCFSIMAANRPGQIVGTAPGASYWLLRTEDASSERPIEEHNWIEAAEWADSAGVDMISSSLGYTNFDDPSYNHSYAQRDGNSVLITIAADMAAKKGILVMNSAGNSGNNSDDTRFIMCPADGDSVFTVGAVNNSGVIGGFSSWGPNSAGKVKPNIVSVGAGAIYANINGDPVAGNGTSYSNPNIAGLVACLWQAFSEFTNMEIIDAVQKSADRYLNPDDRYGYGIPNFREAYTILLNKREERTNSILKGKWITAFPIPFSQLFTLFIKAPSTGTANIRILDITGRLILEKNMSVQQGMYYNFRMAPPGTQRYGTYFLQYFDGKNKSVLKLMSL